MIRFKTFMNESVNVKGEERHIVKVALKYRDIEVHFIKNLSGNPNLPGFDYSTIAYEVDHEGRRSDVNHHGSYNKLYDDEKKWRSARDRLKKKHAKLNENYTPPKLKVGDEVKVGKWKNRKAVIKGFTKDKHNQPVLKTNKGDQKLFKPRISKLEEGYKIKLERNSNMYVLNITDTKNGNRTEVRGKSGYEGGGYDSKDKLHQLLDKIGRSANVSELINGSVVTINPKHPNAASAKTALVKAFNESEEK